MRRGIKVLPPSVHHVSCNTVGLHTSLFPALPTGQIPGDLGMLTILVANVHYHFHTRGCLQEASQGGGGQWGAMLPPLSPPGVESKPGFFLL